MILRENYLMKKLNLPNKLTVFRLLLVPVFVFFILIDEDLGLGPTGDYIALGVFVLASITDFFDGYIARKENLVTNFGKFMDPLADKLLVCSAFICLSSMGRIRTWETVLVVCREFVISGIRLIAAEDGVVISASIWGKIKTVVSMTMIIAVILHLHVNLPPAAAAYFGWWAVFEQILIYASVVFTVVSLIDYIFKNRHVLKDELLL